MTPSRAKRLEVGLFFVLLAVVAALTVALAQRPGPVAIAQEGTTPAREVIQLPPLPEGDLLLFTSVDTPSLLAAPMPSGEIDEPIPAEQIQRLIQWGTPAEEPAPSPAGGETLLDETVQPDAEEETGHGGGPVVGTLAPSPDGRRVAVQTYMGLRSVGWVLDLADRQAPMLTRFVAEGWGDFLGWHPDSIHALYRVFDLDVPDPGLWIVNTNDGTHQRVEIPELAAPEGIIAATFSPDGQQLAYAFTNGLGFGSELWLSDATGHERRLVRKDEAAISGGLVWSPDGTQLAFTSLLDSAVPFSQAGVWIVNAEGADPKILALMDGGRGQEPVWSPDGQQLFFIARENPGDITADFEADKLISSVKAVDATNGEISTVVSAESAYQVDLTLTPSGDLLFSSNRHGSLELWRWSAEGNLRALTADGEAKRHSLIVSSSQ
ncbi:MAG: hypothetical protein DCC55_11645 [Chloroflexi bacterium]|nr:MAG: hypothetical protein DCC55_11645 [Chloroflexota bacterium]